MTPNIPVQTQTTSPQSTEPLTVPNANTTFQNSSPQSTTNVPPFQAQPSNTQAVAQSSGILVYDSEISMVNNY